MRKNSHEKNEKKTKKFLGRGYGRWEMVEDLNLGPHVQVELSGPCRELVIFFENFKNWGWVILGAKTTNLHPAMPRFFFVILEALWTSNAGAKLEKNRGELTRESRGQS